MKAHMEVVVLNHGREPTFLPLTVAVTTSAATAPGTPAVGDARVVRSRAEETDTVAAGCWAALLGGCHPPERRALPTQLSALAEATSRYVGDRWWSERGVGYRRRVASAQLRINDAVREGDGEEFAEAFVGYDQAIAEAVMSVQQNLERATQ
ncbi:hypothetical protein SAMN04487904_110111 [Actinopolyspora lacussalsi subsp. righensis]|uniref:SAV-6107-like HEPN domain-containing protein n=2 Tax=Actinopolyspora righensis TaxID=995060 RepID=A0A1I7BBE7_9ACTN|nr:hypothetical protein [Actinopolyspora righensis]SFT84523.1 hypothetical protein SAMN04487904_110111 [Actinopolyspora righensis]